MAPLALTNLTQKHENGVILQGLWGSRNCIHSHNVTAMASLFLAPAHQITFGQWVGLIAQSSPWKVGCELIRGNIKYIDFDLDFDVPVATFGTCESRCCIDSGLPLNTKQSLLFDVLFLSCVPPTIFYYFIMLAFSSRSCMRLLLATTSNVAASW